MLLRDELLPPGTTSLSEPNLTTTEDPLLIQEVNLSPSTYCWEPGYGSLTFDCQVYTDQGGYQYPIPDLEWFRGTTRIAVNGTLLITGEENNYFLYETNDGEQLEVNQPQLVAGSEFFCKYRAIESSSGIIYLTSRWNIVVAMV